MGAFRDGCCAWIPWGHDLGFTPAASFPAFYSCHPLSALAPVYKSHHVWLTRNTQGGTRPLQVTAGGGTGNPAKCPCSMG